MLSATVLCCACRPRRQSLPSVRRSWQRHRQPSLSCRLRLSRCLLGTMQLTGSVRHLVTVVVTQKQLPACCFPVRALQGVRLSTTYCLSNPCLWHASFLLPAGPFVPHSLDERHVRPSRQRLQQLRHRRRSVWGAPTPWCGAAGSDGNPCPRCWRSWRHISVAVQGRRKSAGHVQAQVSMHRAAVVLGGGCECAAGSVQMPPAQHTSC